jgi:hypothetical protein
MLGDTGTLSTQIHYKKKDWTQNRMLTKWWWQLLWD